VKHTGIFCLIASCLPLWVLAEPVPVRVTNTTVFQSRTDNQNGQDDDDNYTSVINRLNLNGTADNITTAVRVDTMGFFGDHQSWHTDDLRLEQLRVQYNIGDWKIQAGDYYRQLGRGIVLSLRKMDEAGRDISLRGGELTYDSSKQSIGLFGGRTNTVNIDILKQRFVDDPNDILAGGWYTLRKIPLGSLKLQGGFHYLLGRAAEIDPGNQTENATSSVGGMLELPDLNGFGALYVEANVQQSRTADQVSQGRALYGSMDLFLGDTSLLVEGLIIEDFTQFGRNNRYNEPVRYNLPPTLDRIDQETSAGQNEMGGRARVEQAFGDGDYVLYANGLYKLIDPDSPSEVTQLHAYGGAKGEYNDGRSRASASGGFRDEIASGRDDGESIKDMMHSEFEVLQYISRGYAVQLAGNYEFRGVENQDGAGRKKYRRGSTYLGLQKSGLGSITVEYGMDNQDTRSQIRQHFLAGIVSWDISESFKMRGTVGSQRGGLKCVAGVCRIYPSFSGYHLEILSNHNIGG